MSSLLIDDPKKDLVIYVNDWSPQFVTAVEKLSRRLGRPLKGVMMIDAERKRNGKYVPDVDNSFEEIIVDFLDDGALRKTIRTIEDRLLIVCCDSEASQLYFKRLIPLVPYVNTPTESSLIFSTDKGKMRELLTNYDPSTSPKALTVHGSSEKDIQDICEKLSFPVMIKPTNLIASLLVNKATNETELRQILERNFVILNDIYSHHRGLGEKAMVVEEFVEGDLFSTDIYVDSIGNVKVLPFIHFQNGAMVGMDSYQVYQSETYHTLNDEEQEQGAKMAKKAVHALALRSSVAHVELFHTDNGWKIVELGARAGGRRQEMYEISYGIDHAFNDLLNKLDIEPEMPSMPAKTHCTTFKIHAATTGILASIEGVEEALKHPNIYYLRTKLKPGEKALPSTLGGVEIIDGFMTNSNHEQLDNDVAKIRESVKVNIVAEGTARESKKNDREHAFA